MSILGPFNPTEILSAGKRLALAVARRVRPDHQAIRRRKVRFMPVNMGRLYLYAVVAPSRWAPREFDQGQVARARAFAEDAFPGIFGENPRIAEKDMTLFTVHHPDSPDSYDYRAVYIHHTGLVELLWALEVEVEDASEESEKSSILLDPVEMITVVARLGTAVGHRTYAELSGVGRCWRRFAKVDWWFHMATSISTPNGPKTWTGLKFPSQVPPRARHDWAAAPLNGYEADQFANRRRKRSSSELARTFFEEFLVANGYYEYSTAVEEVMAAALASPEQA